MPHSRRNNEGTVNLGRWVYKRTLASQYVLFHGNFRFFFSFSSVKMFSQSKKLIAHLWYRFFFRSFSTLGRFMVWRRVWYPALLPKWLRILVISISARKVLHFMHSKWAYHISCGSLKQKLLQNLPTPVISNSYDQTSSHLMNKILKK